MKRKIYFFTEDIDFDIKQKSMLREWIGTTIRQEGFTQGELNFIFCSDDYLLNINRQYLDHDTYTDIITFDNSEKEEEISGDIFISVPRVVENAVSLGVDQTEEMRRVIIHGVLHLAGYLDKSPKDKDLMTEKEDYYLARYQADPQ